tara:strand:+ start:471 stop:869 length:399 start_codon:yes stop_codon:yes gene_type:complete
LWFEVILLPTITYKGPRRTGANMGRLGWWIWGQSRTVSAEWLEANRVAVDGPEFVIEGHILGSSLTVNKGRDDTPDMGWKKGDIMGWMDDEGIEYSALSTKAKLLALIDAHLNSPEESINEAEEAEIIESDE